MPWRSYEQIVNDGTAYNDWCDAIQFAQQHLLGHRLRDANATGAKPGEELDVIAVSDDDAELYVYLFLRIARKFVKAEWQTIVRVGDALIVSSKRMLTFRECAGLAATTVGSREPGTDDVRSRNRATLRLP